MNRNIKIDFIKKTISACRGFSLIEMIISLVIGGIIVAAIAPIFSGSARSFYTVTAGNEDIQAARIGFNRMMADLRDINGSTAITSGTATSITFTSVNTGNPVITYAQSGSTITRTKTNIPNAVMIPNVSYFQIQYFRTSGGGEVSAPVASPTDVWSIQVTLRVNVAGQNMTFQSTVHPRNIF